jgi:hypothetical protein
MISVEPPNRRLGASTLRFFIVASTVASGHYQNTPSDGSAPWQGYSFVGQFDACPSTAPDGPNSNPGSPLVSEEASRGTLGLALAGLGAAGVAASVYWLAWTHGAHIETGTVASPSTGLQLRPTPNGLAGSF